MPKTVAEIIKEVQKAGWTQIPGGKGSHRKFVHDTRPGLLIIPGQTFETLPKGTEHNIRKTAGI